MTDETPVTTDNKAIPSVERNWASFVHIAAFAGFLFPSIPLLMVIAPLLIWLIQRKDKPFLDDQGKEALNFQITILIGFVICVPLIFIIIGIYLIFILTVTDVILVIIAAVHANKGERYRYPFALRLIK